MPSHFSSRPLSTVTLGASSGSAAGGNGTISTFGELLTVTPHAVAQGDFVYGINDNIFLSGTYGNSTVTETGNIAVLTSGTGSNSYSFLRTRRTVRYRAGQGSLIRLTAIFDTGSEGNKQLIGAGNRTNGYYFGYSGSYFGIIHDENGDRAVRKMSITANNVSNVTASLTINGTVVSVPLLAGNSSSLANQIAKYNWFNVGPEGGWEVMANGADVLFIANNQYPATGTFSAASVTATFTTKVTGSNSIDTFISQSSFNIDKVDGTGPSGFNLNQQKGNVYQIGFQYLGFGNAFFQIENPETGYMTPVHMIKNANARTKTVLKNHNVSPRWFNGNTLTSGTGPNTTLKAASCAAFLEGIPNASLFLKFALNQSKNLAIANAVYPIITLRPNIVHRETIDCLGQIVLQKISVAAAASASKFTTCYVYKNAVLSNDALFKYVDSTRSITSYDTSASSFTGGTLVYSFTLSDSDSLADNITNYDFVAQAGETLTIALESNDNASGNTPSVSIVWAEEQ